MKSIPLYILMFPVVIAIIIFYFLLYIIATPGIIYGSFIHKITLYEEYEIFRKEIVSKLYKFNRL